MIARDIEPTEAALEVDGGLDEAYVDYLAASFHNRLEGTRLVVDCANGASVHLAPELFTRLGAEVIAIGCEPDGRNINLDCGALHLESLRSKVLESGAHAGVAFDGDADRLMLVSQSGRIIDGDAMLLIAADDRIAKGEHPTIVATVMSNLGLELALKERGIELVRTAVGDKYVLEEMRRRGATIGGEHSGHVIFLSHATTGDGMLTALRVLDVMAGTGRTLDELASDLKTYPQTLLNIRVKVKRPLEELASVQEEIDKTIRSFGGAGRVLVRFSGTEPLARVMVEGPDASEVILSAQRIAKAVEAALG